MEVSELKERDSPQYSLEDENIGASTPTSYGSDIVMVEKISLLSASPILLDLNHLDQLVLNYSPSNMNEDEELFPPISSLDSIHSSFGYDSPEYAFSPSINSPADHSPSSTRSAELCILEQTPTKMNENCPNNQLCSTEIMLVSNEEIMLPTMSSSSTSSLIYSVLKSSKLYIILACIAVVFCCHKLLVNFDTDTVRSLHPGHDEKVIVNTSSLTCPWVLRDEEQVIISTPMILTDQDTTALPPEEVNSTMLPEPDNLLNLSSLSTMSTNATNDIEIFESNDLSEGSAGDVEEIPFPLDDNDPSAIYKLPRILSNRSPYWRLDMASHDGIAIHLYSHMRQVDALDTSSSSDCFLSIDACDHLDALDATKQLFFRVDPDPLRVNNIYDRHSPVLTRDEDMEANLRELRHHLQHLQFKHDLLPPTPSPTLSSTSSYVDGLHRDWINSASSIVTAANILEMGPKLLLMQTRLKQHLRGHSPMTMFYQSSSMRPLYSIRRMYSSLLRMVQRMIRKMRRLYHTLVNELDDKIFSRFSFNKFFEVDDASCP